MHVCMNTCENADVCMCGTHIEVRGPYEAWGLTYAFFDTGVYAVGHCIHQKACARLAD